MAEMKKHKKIIAGFIILGILGSGTTVFAGPPRGHFPGFIHGPAALFELIIVGTRHLFFRDGAFYHRGPAGYVPVPAPEGAVIPACHLDTVSELLMMQNLLLQRCLLCPGA